MEYFDHLVANESFHGVVELIFLGKVLVFLVNFLDSRLKRFREEGDVSGDGFAFECGGDSTTLRVTQNKDGVDAEGGDSVFKGGIDFGGIETACISTYKKVAHAHVENQFDGSAGVGAGKDCDGRGLAECPCLRHVARLPRVGDRLACCKTFIAFFESGFGTLHFDFGPAKRSCSQGCD